MEEKNNILLEDVEVPEIVLEKAEEAFTKIRMEGTDNMMEKKNSKRKTIIKKQAVAAACICVLAVGSVSVVAAVHHFWGRGMQGALQASDKQQQELTDQGIATVISEEENYESLAVSVGDVTVKPNTVIVDGKFAYLSFSVEGYTVGEGVEPAFEFVDAYLGDDPNAEEGWLNMSGSFYDGIVTDETGAPVYDDGSPLEYGEDGDFISHYTDENGVLEYVIVLFSPDSEESLLGKTLHVDFSNLGTVYKAEYTGVMEGEWNFDIPLSGKSAATDILVDTAIEGTVFVVDSVELSPISIKVNYSVNGEVSVVDDENGIPEFCGVVLKDGTRLPYLGNGGMSAYTDETMTEAYVTSGFDRVINPDQVETLLFRTGTGTDYSEVELDAK